MKPLVEKCLADNPTEMPEVSHRITNMKEQYDRQH